jgi:micrococcal nuclease
MYEYTVRELKRVIDGDTVDVVIDLGFSINTVQRIRLIGLDTPEMNSRDERERRMAVEARDFVVRWFGANPNPRVRTTKDDKYGRMLGEFWGTESLNESLVDGGWAWAYDGSTKEKNLDLLLEKRKA